MNSAFGRSLNETSMEMDVRDVMLFDACICSIAEIDATHVNHLLMLSFSLI